MAAALAQCAAILARLIGSGRLHFDDHAAALDALQAAMAALHAQPPQ